MTLPFSSDYLSMALVDGLRKGERTLIHRHVGNLHLPTGALVACDPFVNPDVAPFRTHLPHGTFPVVLSIEEYGNDQRVAGVVPPEGESEE